MTITEAVENVINLALKEVGYTPYSGKRTKYADDLDKLGNFYNSAKSGYDWCDVFFDWLFVKSFGADIGRRMLYQPLKSGGAGCWISAQYYRDNNAWSILPQIGSQVFYGITGDEYHTGLVYALDNQNIYTVEGNTGGGNGTVKKRTVSRSTYDISGYGIPKWELVKDIKDSAGSGTSEKAENASNNVENSGVSKKDLDTIAREVIRGEWGNGEERKKKLLAAGYVYSVVQHRVNSIIDGLATLPDEKKETVSAKTIEEIAIEVIRGEWGNGTDRKERLEKAGYNYSEVQGRVNQIFK